MEPICRKKIGEMLVERKIIDEGKLAKGLVLQKKSGKLLGQCLIELGFIDEDTLTQTLAAQFDMPFISLKNYTLDPELIAKIPLRYLTEQHIVPIDRFGRITTVAVCDFLSDEHLAELESIFKCKVKCFLASVSELKAAIEKYQGKST